MREGLRLCDASGCDELGEHRAPRSRDQLNSYYWFCLEHVRAYNQHWNFYAGMSQAEIEIQIRADTTWWRPTWPLGAQARSGQHGKTGDPYINFSAFGQEDWDHENIKSESANSRGWHPRPGSVEAEALALLNLEPPVTRDAIKLRYKALVKQHHPDANGGNREAEERLKIINRAYSVLQANTDL